MNIVRSEFPSVLIPKVAGDVDIWSTLGFFNDSQGNVITSDFLEISVLVVEFGFGDVTVIQSEVNGKDFGPHPGPPIIDPAEIDAVKKPLVEPRPESPVLEWFRKWDYPEDRHISSGVGQDALEDF